jgi:hypothetical protein
MFHQKLFLNRIPVFISRLRTFQCFHSSLSSVASRVYCAPVCCSTLYCCHCPSIENYRNDDGKSEIRVSIAACICPPHLQSLFRIRKGWICIFQAIIKTHHVIQREVEAVARPRSPRSGVELDLLSPTSHRFGLQKLQLGEWRIHLGQLTTRF